MPYGQDEKNGHPHIGSLDLIDQVSVTPLFSLGEKVAGQKSQKNEEADEKIGVPHDFFDVMIMNPPFTRPTGHEAGKIGVPVPSFAGFRTSDEEQKAMSSRLKQIRRSLPQPAGHGNAGLASNFIDLAHVKLKPGGVLALVLPATFASGQSWEAARNLLIDCYQDITVVSIADTGMGNRAFSADTSIAEVLVLATKNGGGGRPKKSAFQFVNLRRRPLHHVEAVELAKFVAGADRQPGTGRIAIGGEDSNGGYINAGQFSCGYAGLAEADIARFMLALLDGIFFAPRTREQINLPAVRLGELGSRGLLHRDITGTPARGPFDKAPLRPGQFPTYPSLWSHAAARERSFVVDADCALLVRKGYEDKAADAWTRFASRLHFTLDFGLNSQSLAACLTPEKTLGGRAWPNFVLDEVEHEKAVVLWFNSTLGLMLYWWTGARQQPGRTIVTISALPSLLSIDPRQFDKTMLAKADALFERFRDARFLPANESYHDANRKALDHALLVDLLGVPADVAADFDVVRRQWCAEPSVHGGKSTRPSPRAGEPS